MKRVIAAAAATVTILTVVATVLPPAHAVDEKPGDCPGVGCISGKCKPLGEQTMCVYEYDPEEHTMTCIGQGAC